MLNGRRILLGVTGSIAAYKAVELLRELTRRGAEIQVVMTRAATRFVPPYAWPTTRLMAAVGPASPFAGPSAADPPPRGAASVRQIVLRAVSCRVWERSCAIEESKK